MSSLARSQTYFLWVVFCLQILSKPSLNSALLFCWWFPSSFAFKNLSSSRQGVIFLLFSLISADPLTVCVVWGHLLEHHQTSGDHTAKEKWLTLPSSYQLSIDPQLQWGCWTPFPCHLLPQQLLSVNACNNPVILRIHPFFPLFPKFCFLFHVVLLPLGRGGMW